jgi:hypothetical protein
MRIGKPAHKHGIAETDIWHAIRNAVRRVDMGESLTMLIGPSSAGTFLEIGILDLEGEDPVVIHAMALRTKFYRFL